MKRMIISVAIATMSVAYVSPVAAQSLKDKKAAKKEQWQREQRQKAEEDELLHQIKIDSIANAQKSHDILCYRLNRLKSGWAKVTRHGSYNVEDKVLIVENERFTVCVNPVYGEKSTPGQFQYKAGPYYFNE